MVHIEKNQLPEFLEQVYFDFRRDVDDWFRQSDGEQEMAVKEGQPFKTDIAGIELDHLEGDFGNVLPDRQALNAAITGEYSQADRIGLAVEVGIALKEVIELVLQDKLEGKVEVNQE